jgi:F-type H+-transporting ATPase subunit b
MKETTDRLAAVAAERQREANAAIAAKTHAAEQSIAAAKAEAMGNLRGLAVDVARAAAARLTGSEVDEARAGAAVDTVLRGHA